jgi:hypothetical protein
MRQQISLYFQRPDTEEHSDIMLFTAQHMLLHKLLTRPVIDFLRKEIRVTQSNKHFFQGPKDTDEVGVFLQTLRDLLPVDIYFSLRKDGPLWIVEHTDADKHMHDHYAAIGSITSSE